MGVRPLPNEQSLLRAMQVQGVLGTKLASPFATTVVLTSVYCNLAMEPALFTVTKLVPSRDQKFVCAGGASLHTYAGAGGSGGSLRWRADRSSASWSNWRQQHSLYFSWVRSLDASTDANARLILHVRLRALNALAWAFVKGKKVTAPKMV
jgi:hypothetical protein